jgi:glycosyltransferase involved in cell wall biosynthesis/LmbE family N-acetylglucosaminyl deacetylase
MKKFLKTKIIISSYDDLKNPYYGGGGAYAVHKIAKRLASYRYQVKVITSKYPGSQDKVLDGVEYKRVGLSFAGPKLGQLIFHFLLPIYVLKEKYDIWVENFTPPFSTSFLPLFTNKPVVGLVHMLAGEDMTRKYKLPFHFLESFGLRTYKHFIVLTDEGKQKILKIKKDANIKIIPNGVDIPDKSRRVKKEHVLFIGRIEINQKGLDLLLRAYKRVSKNNAEKLVIAGSGVKKEVTLLKKRIRELKLEDCVEYIGKVKGDKKIRLLKKAHLLVIPSRFETFSIAALEAFSFSLPIVCFDIAGLSWVPKECALKARPFSETALAKSISQLLNNERLRNKTGRCGQKIVKNYSWDKAYSKYDKFFKEIIKGKKWKDNNDGALFIKSIIKNKTPCYFISPHLDDAVLSAGGLISYLSKNVPVNVINVFSKGDRRPYTFSAKRFLSQSGYKDTEGFYRERAIEDKRVLRDVNIKPHDLEFVDALWRKDKNGRKHGVMGRLIPELNHVYPTYRFHVKSGKVSKNDSVLARNIQRKLKKVINGDLSCIVFCPIAQGNHVDHILTREICSKNFKNVVYWLDYPYSLHRKREEEFVKDKDLHHFEFSKYYSQKRRLISGYKSQIGALFPKGRINLVPEKYYFGELNLNNN